jgi:hypothetical protein
MYSVIHLTISAALEHFVVCDVTELHIREFLINSIYNV